MSIPQLRRLIIQVLIHTPLVHLMEMPHSAMSLGCGAPMRWPLSRDPEYTFERPPNSCVSADVVSLTPWSDRSSNDTFQSHASDDLADPILLSLFQSL
jgi:hypothetical protein